jgi:hypothetical protein
MISILISSALALVMQTSGFVIPDLPSAPAPDKVLVKVGGVDIMAKEVQDLLWEVRGEEILNDLIYAQVAKAEAAKVGVIVTDAEVNEAVQKELVTMKANLAPGVTMEEAMAQIGQTKSRIFLSIKTSLLLNKIAFAEFDPKFYVRVSTILSRPPSTSTADVSASITLIQNAYERLQKGEAWTKVFEEIVQDPEGRRTNGVLGWRNISAFPEEIRKEFTNAKRGNLTKPIQTANGIQLFRIDALGTKLEPGELETMKTELADILRASTVQRLRASMKIERLWPKPKVTN